ncbi:DUF1269 domain-containing protein [Sphingopyxis sp. BSNA05]|uniref:DUF1269 domain-containing protein n=1 Tax=Sphingopyxis sp. BSNA05 TaxID=1236614 RepID=UPI001C27DCF7|nr:DUF1269 domain-containing protein [Sphingopyxis sp. BSNA05]
MGATYRLSLFAPIIGVLAGAASGALANALSDYGISNKFMKDIASMLKPEQAALFIMVPNTISDRVIEKLAKHGGDVLRTNLESAHEKWVRDAFASAHKEIEDSETVQ